MYSNNNEISDRQIFRQIIVSTLPLGLLFFPAVTWKLGILFSTIAGILLWLLTVAVILVGNKFVKNGTTTGRTATNSAKVAGERSKWVGIKAAVFLVKLRYIALTAICIMVLIRASKDLLLNEMNALVILVFTGLVIYYFQCHSDEVFARFVETVFILVIAPIIISVLLGIFNIDFKSIAESVGNIVDNTAVEGGLSIRPAKMTIGEYALMIVIGMFSFVPCSALFVNDAQKAKLCKSPGVIIKAYTFSWLVVLVTNVVLWLQPVSDFMADGKYPLLTMLKTVGIPGGFMERQEALFGMFIIMSLIIQTGGFLKICTDKDKKKASIGWIGVAVIGGLLIFAGISGDMGDLTMKKDLYTGKDIEDREYVLTIGIDKEPGEDKFQITFTVENSDIKAKTYKSGTLKDTISVYRDQCEKMVDFTHTKLIVLGEEVLESEDMLEEIKKYIKEDNIGLNVLVCKSSEEIKDLVKNADKVSKDFGIYVSDLLVKSGYEKINAAFVFGHDYGKIGDVIVEKAAKISVNSGVPVID